VYDVIFNSVVLDSDVCQNAGVGDLRFSDSTMRKIDVTMRILSLLSIAFWWAPVVSFSPLSSVRQAPRISALQAVTATAAAAYNSSSVIVLSETQVAGGGTYQRIQHASKSTGTDMIFGLFLPSMPTASVLFWLGGFKCNESNFATKADAFAAAELAKLAIVLPDTSPRGNDVPDVDSYDLGQGAGFYVDATEEPYKEHYQMYSYITKELVGLLRAEYRLRHKCIAGHGMGGHGALTIALKAPEGEWTSVSALSPIANPSYCPWGQKAFEAYLGSVDAGKKYDASLLLMSNSATMYDDILIDQGTMDQFLEEQLRPDALLEAAERSGQEITFSMRDGYDHSYDFISAFIGNHIRYHSTQLDLQVRGLGNRNTYEFAQGSLERAVERAKKLTAARDWDESEDYTTDDFEVFDEYQLGDEEWTDALRDDVSKLIGMVSSLTETVGGLTSEVSRSREQHNELSQLNNELRQKNDDLHKQYNGICEQNNKMLGMLQQLLGKDVPLAAPTPDLGPAPEVRKAATPGSASIKHASNVSSQGKLSVSKKKKSNFQKNRFAPEADL
jgi:S-formylglutathione hydrolase